MNMHSSCAPFVNSYSTLYVQDSSILSKKGTIYPHPKQALGFFSPKKGPFTPSKTSTWILFTISLYMPKFTTIIAIYLAALLIPSLKCSINTKIIPSSIYIAVIHYPFLLCTFTNFTFLFCVFFFSFASYSSLNFGI